MEINIEKRVCKDKRNSLILKFDLPKQVIEAINWNSSESKSTSFSTPHFSGERRLVWGGMLRILEEDEVVLFSTEFLKTKELACTEGEIDSILEYINSGLAKIVCMYEKYGGLTKKATKKSIKKVLDND